MHARITSVRGATDIDEGVVFIREKVLSELDATAGFRGLHFSANRDTGDAGVLTLWDSEGALRSSEEAVVELRASAVAAMGGDASVAEYEQTAFEFGDPPPSAGCKLLIREISMNPAVIDDNVAFFKAEVVPLMRAQPGFRGLRQMINRSTGKGIVGTVWSDSQSLEEAKKAADARRAMAEPRGVEFGAQAVRDMLLIHLR